MTTLTVNVTLANAGDTTPPTLALLLASEVGATGWSLVVNTNEDNGTLFARVTQNATENAATVKAGASQTVSATGTQNVTGGGLSPETTYYAHVLHRDAAGNESAVLSSSAFTTDALGSGTGTVTLSIARQGNLGVAPHPVHFEVGVTGASVSEPANRTLHDPTFAGLHYEIAFGDSGVVSDKLVNVAAAHNDFTRGYTKIPAHVYQTPGSYTATVTVYEEDGTFVGSDTVAVAVGDPDATFTGNRTILVGPPDANYSGAQVVSTIEQAVTALDALSTTGQILVAGGSDHTLTSEIRMNANFNASGFRMGAYGTGARPIIRATPGAAELFLIRFEFNTDFVLDGLDLRAGWNAATETGATAIGISFNQRGNSKRGCINDCLLGGFNIAIQGLIATSDTSSMAIHNCRITNWQDYGLYAQENINAWWSITGSAFDQNDQAMMGGGEKLVQRNNHGPLRFTYAGNVYIDGCDTFSRNTWTVTLASQPSLRWNTTGNYDPTRTRLAVTRCSMEGGQPVMGIGTWQGSGFYGTDAVIEKTIIAGHSVTSSFVNIDFAGVILRNCLMFMPNVPRMVATNWNAALSTDAASGCLDRTSPSGIYNCTIVNLLNDANRNGASMPLVDNSGALGVWFVQNNAFHQPNATGQPNEAIDVSQAALATVGGTWAPRFLGKKHQAAGAFPAQLTMNATYASPAGFVWNATPGASSPLVGDATSGRRAYDDFFGTVRGGANDRGAVERT
jgi:hypothetical protein